MTARLSQIRPVPRRGLSRDEAAMYVGISPSKFDELLADGRMPSPAASTAAKCGMSAKSTWRSTNYRGMIFPPVVLGMIDDEAQTSIHQGVSR
jgi:hypothetical protein